MIALGAMILLAGSGCAGTPKPDAELARSETAVKQAIEVGAREHAPLQLRSAEQKLAQAKAAAQAKDNARARRLAEQAQVDAEVAEVTALATKAQKSVDELQQSIRLLRKELGVTQ